MRVHVSQAYRKIEMTKDRISLTNQTDDEIGTLKVGPLNMTMSV